MYGRDMITERLIGLKTTQKLRFYLLFEEMLRVRDSFLLKVRPTFTLEENFDGENKAFAHICAIFLGISILQINSSKLHGSFQDGPERVRRLTLLCDVTVLGLTCFNSDTSLRLFGRDACHHLSLFFLLHFQKNPKQLIKRNPKRAFGNSKSSAGVSTKGRPKVGLKGSFEPKLALRAKWNLKLRARAE